MPRASGSKMMMQDVDERKKGYHRMASGKMMKNSEMRKKKKSKYAGMLYKGK